jgi:hypothetical protein
LVEAVSGIKAQLQKLLAVLSVNHAITEFYRIRVIKVKRQNDGKHREQGSQDRGGYLRQGGGRWSIHEVSLSFSIIHETSS